MQLASEAMELMSMAGWMSVPLLLSAALLMFGITSRYIYLLRGFKGTVRKLIYDIEAGRDVGESILISCVREGLRIKAQYKGTNLNETLEENFRGFEQQTSKYRSLVETLVMIAPLMGLLGTVMGMIETFESLGDMALFTSGGGIAGGISQALITTQMGLLVAIPGLLFERSLRRKEDKLLEEIFQSKEIICQQ